MPKRLPSQKKKLIVTLSLLLIAGFLATSLVSYFAALSSLRSQIFKTELPLISENFYSNISKDFSELLTISSMMANNTFLQEWINSGEKEMEKITTFLAEITEKYHTLTSFFVSEKTRIYYQSKGILKHVREDEERDIWYFRVRDMKQDYEFNLDPDLANNDTMTVFVNYKVFDAKHNFLGAIGVGLKINTLAKLISEHGETMQRNIYLVSRDGRIIVRNDPKMDEYQHLRDVPGLTALADSLLINDQTIFKYKHKGQTIHLNSRFIPELDLILVVEKPEESITEGISRALIFNLAICLIITALMIFLATLNINIFMKVVNNQQKLIFTKNSELEAKNAEQEILIKEKSDALEANILLMREMNHRVKNNLAIMQSLLRIQSSESLDDTSRKALKDSESRLKSITHLHQMLSQNVNLSQINAAVYFTNLVRDITTAFDIENRNIRIDLQVDPLSLDMNILVPLALALNELLTNSLKYAFPKNRSGNITLILRETEDNNLEILFADDGIGLPEDFDLSAGDSLGTKIISMLINQIHGKMEVESQKDKGTKFRIIIPEAEK